MMQAIRDRAQSWIAWIIVIFLIIVFALWGVQGYVGGTSSTDVAEVNGIPITERDFEDRYRVFRDQQRQQLLQAFGNDADNPLFKQLFNEEVMRQRVLEGMVQSRLLTLAAIKAGFNLDDEQLNNIIRQVPVFQRDGQFDKDAYTQALRLQGMNNKSFKSRLMQDEITGQFTSGLRETAFATPQQVDNWLKLQGQQRNFSYLTLKKDSYRHAAEIDDDMIKAYYDSNTRRFMTDEQLSIEYVELSAEKLSNDAADEQALLDYYEDRKTDYAVVDTSSQIELLKAARERLLAGESFASVAAEISEDSGSAANAGNIGLISRVDMEVAFSDAAFALDKGEISQPVQTSFGMHLIKVNDIQGEQRDVSHILLKVDPKKLRTRSFDEVRTEVEKELRAYVRERRFAEQFQLLSNISYEQPDTLEPVATELGLKIQTSDSFTRKGGKGLLANPAVLTAAFSADVLAGNNSEPVELADERAIVLRVKDYQPAAPRALEEVNDVIIQNLVDDFSREQVRNKGAELVAKLTADGGLEGLASAEKAEVVKAGKIKRDDTSLSRELVDAVFSMQRPEAGKTSYQGIELASGDYAVIALNEVEDGDPTRISKEERLAATRTVTALMSERDYTALRTDLRQRADVVFFNDDSATDSE